LGLQAVKNFFRKEFVGCGHQAVAPAGFAENDIAHGLETAEALPDPGPAQAHPGCQDFPGDKAVRPPKETQNLQEPGVRSRDR